MKTGIRVALKLGALILISLIEPIGNALSQKPQQHTHMEISEAKMKKRWQVIYHTN